MFKFIYPSMTPSQTVHLKKANTLYGGHLTRFSEAEHFANKKYKVRYMYNCKTYTAKRFFANPRF